MKSWGIKYYKRRIVNLVFIKLNDYKRFKAIKKKKLSEMSNDEVKQLVTRMQLEKQFKDLNPSVVNMGAKIVTDVLKETVKQELATQVRGNIKLAKDKRNAK